MEIILGDLKRCLLINSYYTQILLAQIMLRILLLKLSNTIRLIYE